jgi:hypothetical protein
MISFSDSSGNPGYSGVDPASTAVYLTITADLMDAAGKRFERFAAPISSGGRP